MFTVYIVQNTPMGNASQSSLLGWWQQDLCSLLCDSSCGSMAACTCVSWVGAPEGAGRQHSYMSSCWWYVVAAQQGRGTSGDEVANIPVCIHARIAGCPHISRGCGRMSIHWQGRRDKVFWHVWASKAVLGGSGGVWARASACWQNGGERLWLGRLPLGEPAGKPLCLGRGCSAGALLMARHFLSVQEL